MQGLRKWGAVTILGAMLAGLGTFLLDHFLTDYPNLKAQVRVLEIQSEDKLEILSDMREDIKEIRQGQIEIYKILVD
jgi:hypothetical protein